MNYKVTFYNNLTELLTERKANFVNKIKHLTSRVFDKLAKETEMTEKTSALSILSHLKLLSDLGKKNWRVGITLDDYRNIEIPMFPNTGKPIPFKFNFIINDSHQYYTKFGFKGHCSYSKLRGEKLISEIYLEIEISFGEDFDKQYTVRKFLDDFQGALTHEIAHAQDEYLTNEIDTYTHKGNTSDEDLRYLTYWLKPTEIRSHMMEMIQLLKSKEYNNPNRTFKNMYKTADKAREFGSEQTEERKNMSKRAYGMLKKSYDSETIDEKSKECLLTVLNRAYHGQCPKLTKQFIFDYHIAFIRDYSFKMKERFYDKYFPNTEAPSLDELNDFFEAIKTVTRTVTKLKKEVEKRYRSYGRDVDQGIIEMVQEFNKLSTNLWEGGEISQAFENYNTKLLKKIGKKIIEDYREKWGFVTKGMLSKQAKEWRKEIGL